MKNVLKIEEMISYLPAKMKDAISDTAKNCGIKVDDLELHRHSHSEKSKTNQLEPEKRQSLSYVSVRTQDRDDEIVIPEALDLKSFLSYRHVLVNHNYSLLPIGSDEHIEADSWGLKALTNHADTGPGTLANVIWSLVSQGHMNAKSVGFVPTSYTKPGARDWDHVANQLSQNWKEFDKGRAEKSISRIITGGVLLEHSFVSVPANSDSVVVGILKGMNLDGKVAKQLGWEMKDGILVTKAAVTDPVPCTCDECGFVADAVVGARCPECKTGAMKAKGKEKAIEIRTTPDKVFVKGKIKKGMGPLSDNELRDALRKLVGSPTATAVQALVGEAYVTEIYEDYFLFTKNGLSNGKEELYFSQGFEVADDGEVTLVGEPEAVKRRVVYEPAQKALPLPCTCDECGAEAECAPGSACQEPDCDGTMVADKKKKAYYAACVCDECGAEADTNPGEACSEAGCKGKMQLKKKAEKSVAEIKVVRPAPSVKVLFVPPSGSEIAQRVGEAVEKALSRRTGKIM
jgi:phage head maturation protease